MRYKKLIFSVILLLGLGITGVQAQTMFLKENNGIQTAYTISDISKISFSSGQIMVSKTGGSSDTYSLTDIRYLNFEDLSVGLPNLEQQINSDLPRLFPNPVSDVFNIAFNTTDNTQITIEILSLDGKVVYKQVLMSNTNMLQANVSFLNKGLYLCRLIYGKDSTTIKFIKN